MHREQRDTTMAAELKNLMKVSISVALSMSYARFATASTPPGLSRLLALLPIVVLLPLLPFSFSTVHLRGISAFFLAWLGVFKLLLLAFGQPPLSPSLPLPTFIAAASLPVKIRPPNEKSPTTPNPLRFLAEFFLLTALTSIYPHKDQLYHFLLLAVYCLHIYLALELVLAAARFLAGSLLGLNLEPQFDAPYRADSLGDFWGRRWNLMVSAVLRPSVYGPVGDRWGRFVGVLATFLVSGVMHEAMFYYLAFGWPTGEVTGFFLLHGVCTAAEGWARRAGWWRPRKEVAGPAAIGFVAATAFWLFFPPLVRSGADETVVREIGAVMGFLEESGRTLVGLVMNQTGLAGS